MFKARVSFLIGMFAFIFMADIGVAKLLTDCECYNCTSGGVGCSPECYQQCIDTVCNCFDCLKKKNCSKYPSCAKQCVSLTPSLGSKLDTTLEDKTANK